MEDETIKKLEMMRKRRIRRNFEIIVIVMSILGAINPVFLLAFSIILMLAGVSMMYNVGDSIARWKTNVLSLNVEDTIKTKSMDESWYIGAIISVIGFLLFLFTLYLMSIGWEGFLTI